MKCIVLAGGSGERLWPLSRKNCPKQFIEISNNHSIFQDTIARNIPYCDEFIIVSNVEYRYLIENQLEPFQGINYRCIYEKEGKKTLPAIALACLSLEPTEYVLVTNTNLIISAPEYKDAIIEAKQNAYEGFLSILASKEEKTDSRYGYVLEKDKNFVKKYKEKPENEIVGEVYQNLGFLVFQNGIFLNSLSKSQHTEYLSAYKTRKFRNGDAYYEDIDVVTAGVETEILEHSDNIKIVEVSFPYKYIRTLEDLNDYKNKGIIVNNTTSHVINTVRNKAIVINGIDDMTVVNTSDALYIGKYGLGIKDILRDSQLKDYSEKSTTFERSWGRYDDLYVDEGYRLRKIIIKPGKTIYEHSHEKRTEQWTILKGKGKFKLNGVEQVSNVGDTITATIGTKHQISNLGDEPLILSEIALGEVSYVDMKSTTTRNESSTSLGISIDPFIKLTPAFKDYLWGGNRLKERYGFKNDLDVVAEAWELSAHRDGESVVSSGRHKGLNFSKYIETVGKEILGWKCAPLQSFPMLVKFIDAKDDLSIQVHPDDDYALEHENQYGKNEMWYVVDSEPGSGIYIGFNKNVDRSEVQERINNNTITEVLNFHPTKPGDIFFIPAGTVHAICKGNLICEIQQSSNCTYRLYDYDRKDKFGNVRELHLDKALNVLNYDKFDVLKGNIACKYFETEIVEVEEKIIHISDDSFVSIIVIDGNGEMSIDDYKLDVYAGDSLFIPAKKNVLNIKGKMKLAISHI